MIPTNQFRLRFDHAAIAQRFLILEAERDSGDYRRSLVPDLALQVGRALAVAYDWGESCYILYDRAKADRSLLKAALEAEAGDVRVREISSAELEQKRASLLALLRQELQRHSGIPLLEGTPGKGDTLFRIVHNKEFYENCPEQDPYKSAPAYCAVQHLTVEDFRLDSRAHAGKSGKEAAALRKVCLLYTSRCV